MLRRLGETSETRPERVAGAEFWATGKWLMLSALLLALAHHWVLPPWMGEDEPWHFDYVTNVSEGHRPLAAWELGPVWKKEWLAEHPAGVWWATHHLADMTHDQAYATQAKIVASMRENRFAERVDHDPRAADPRTWDEFQGSGGHYHAYAQPGLYYVVSGALLSLAGISDAETGLYFVRGLSLLTYLTIVWITVGLARLVASDERTVILAGILAAWWPMHVRQAAVVNNDVLVKVFVGASILFSARFAKERGGLRNLVWAILFLIAGLATKTTAIGALGALGSGLLLARGLPRRARWLAFGATLVVVGGIIVTWFLASNNAVPRTFERFLERVGQGASPTKLALLVATAIGTTNWESRWLDEIVYQLVELVLLGGLLLAAIGLAWRPPDVSRRMVLFCWAAALTQVVLIILHGEAHGRYLSPMLPAMAVLVAIGFTGVTPRRWRTGLLFATAASVAVFEAWFLWGQLIPNHYWIWGA